jgi:flagellar motor protein MotB
MARTFMTGPIGQQAGSYRQGVVLGLTMAEVMLLLVFCLLLASGALLVQENDARNELESKVSALEEQARSNEDLVASLSRLPQLREALERAAPTADRSTIDEFWRKLVLSSSVVDELERHGLSAAEARRQAPDLAEAAELLSRGVRLDEAERNAAIVAAVASRFPGRTLSDGEMTGAIGAAVGGQGSQDGHRWPPIIRLSEADRYYFKTGRAELTPEFEIALRRSVIPSLLATAREYGVDVIEVVGHTDERPIIGRPSNLDEELPRVLSGETGIETLRLADNAGLGLARALAVVKVLESDRRLAAYRILPLSGGQLIELDETRSRGTAFGDVEERRRIEIRLRKSSLALRAER